MMQRLFQTARSVLSALLVPYGEAGSDTRGAVLYTSRRDRRVHAVYPDGTEEVLGAGGGGGGGAPTNAQYLTLATDATLTAERVLTMGNGLDAVDGGAGGNYTVTVDETELDHAALGSRAWTSSGHTGTASRVAAFDGGGAASYLQVGVDLQAYDAQLAAIAAQTPAAGDLTYWTSSTAAAQLAIGDPGQVVTPTAAGTAPSWVDGGVLLYGDGSDGNATFDGSTAVTGCTLSGSEYSATQDLFVDVGTFSNGVSLWARGFIVRFRKLVGPGSGMAYIHDDGNDASGLTAGATLSTTNTQNRQGGGGGTGRGTAGTGSNGVGSGGTTLGGQGGGGGAGGGNAGGNGGSVTVPAGTSGDSRGGFFALCGRTPGGSAFNGGSGGGSGGFAAGGSGGNAGGGGGGAGVLICHAAWIVNAAQITFAARGGTGGAATAGTSGAKGGGGGGGGGYVRLHYVQADAAPTVDISGGTGGAGALGGATGADGSAGSYHITQGL